MLGLIDMATAGKVTREAKSTVVCVLEALGSRWPTLGAAEQRMCFSLQTKSWLPADADASEWYRPGELHATFNRNLFASQAKFLDVPLRVQQSVAGFLEGLGVSVRPNPFQVVRHLLRCAEMGGEPPRGVYEWLSQNASPSQLRELRGKACLRVQGNYLRPDEVVWGSHPFGRFRVQLGPELRSLQALLEALGVRERPSPNDAIDVLKDIAEDVGNSEIESDDKGVVMRCWVMLSEALERGDLGAGSIVGKLGDIQCVPTDQGRLNRPSWMFFEDRAGLADRFASLLEQNCIQRTERAWPAMDAAGVRPISEVVLGYVDDCVNPDEDQWMSSRVSDRARLITTILEGTSGTIAVIDGDSLLSNIRFTRGDKLTVRWKLNAFDRTWSDTPPEPVSAHWDSEEKILYYVNRGNGDPPWSAIARELTLALAPSENPVSISPGLKSVLEADTADEARAQLSELGIAPVQTLEPGDTVGMIASSLGDVADQNDGGVHLGGAAPIIPGSNNASGEPSDPFARLFHEVQAITPSPPSDNLVALPMGGPNTTKSARDYTARSGRVGSTEAHQISQVKRTELGPEGRELAEEFRDMVHGDYGKRCQICSRTFVRTGGGWQVNVVHVVPPRTDHRTNHFGDLLGLCGWHFALMRYGEWAIIDSGTGQPFDDLDGSLGWKRMRSFISSRKPTMDTGGISYIGLPVRFSNVYREWKSEPMTIRTEIRYSIPHWEFLRELLNA